MNSNSTIYCEIVDDEAVKELKDVHNDNENDLNDEKTYSGPLSQVAGKYDQRSDEVELLLATECQKSEICIEMCL